MNSLARFCLVLLCFFCKPVQAHEFWLEAENYAPTDNVRVTLHVGQNFRGATYGYIPGRTALFQIAVGDRVEAIAPLVGDNPVTVAVPKGLRSIAYQSSGDRITYNTQEKFIAFVDEKDLAVDVRQQHYPMTERYVRYAKLLMMGGEDVSHGLHHEFVMDSVKSASSALLTGQLLYAGKPSADALVTVFERDAERDVQVLHFRTDGEGRFKVPFKDGHIYLFDAVAIEPLEPLLEGGASWLTHWAALTVAAPSLLDVTQD